MWIGVGSGTNTIAYSYDGFNWFGLGTNIFDVGNYVAWNESIFIALGSTNSETYMLALSTDGIVWRGISMISSIFSSVSSIAWNGIMWIVVGSPALLSSNCAAYSYDGINWTSIAINQSIANTIAWNGNMWIIGTVHNTVYSYDGLNWTNNNNAILSSTIMKCIIWNGDMWILDTNNEIYYSYDGHNFILIEIPFYGNSVSNINGLVGSIGSLASVYIQQPFVAGGSAGSNTLAYSVDGINWKGLGKIIFTSRCVSVVWNGSIWIACGYDGGNSGKQHYSYDGINWYTKLINYTKSINSMIWNGTFFVGVGADSNINNQGLIILYDKYGNYYNEYSVSNLLYDITYNGSYYIFANSTENQLPITYTQTLGSFTTDINIVSGDCYGISYNSQYFIAVGSQLTIDQNPYSIVYTNVNNLTTWTGITDSIFTQGNSIAYNGTMFVVVGIGSTGSIGYSVDGINWNFIPGSNLIFGTGNKVAWTGKKWIATGIPGDATQYSMAYSYNGIKWYGIESFKNTTSPSPVFTSGSAISSNSKIGAIVVDSQLTLSKGNLPNTQTLDLVSDTYYDPAYTNFTSRIISKNL